MPEEQDKAIPELPRDREVVDLSKKPSGADPLPPRSSKKAQRLLVSMFFDSLEANSHNR